MDENLAVGSARYNASWFSLTHSAFDGTETLFLGSFLVPR